MPETSVEQPPIPGSEPIQRVPLGWEVVLPATAEKPIETPPSPSQFEASVQPRVPSVVAPATVPDDFMPDTITTPTSPEQAVVEGGIDPEVLTNISSQFPEQTAEALATTRWGAQTDL